MKNEFPQEITLQKEQLSTIFMYSLRKFLCAYGRSMYTHSICVHLYVYLRINTRMETCYNAVRYLQKANNTVCLGDLLSFINISKATSFFLMAT